MHTKRTHLPGDPVGRPRGTDLGGSSNGAGPATAQHVYLLLYRAGPIRKLPALTGSYLSGGSAFHDLLLLRKPAASPRYYLVLGWVYMLVVSALPP
jgi:hypothetical protein